MLWVWGPHSKNHWSNTTLSFHKRINTGPEGNTGLERLRPPRSRKLVFPAFISGVFAVSLNHALHFLLAAQKHMLTPEMMKLCLKPAAGVEHLSSAGNFYTLIQGKRFPPHPCLAGRLGAVQIWTWLSHTVISF